MPLTIDDIIENPRRPISITTGRYVEIPMDRHAMQRRLVEQRAAMDKERERIEAQMPPGKYPVKRRGANDNTGAVSYIAA